MKIDVFRTIQTDDDYTYLAIPHGKNIPEDAANKNWILSSENIYISQDDDSIEGLDAYDVLEQIRKQGYAVSHTEDKVHIGSTAL
jgi:hypothetical protein